MKEVGITNYEDEYHKNPNKDWKKELFQYHGLELAYVFQKYNHKISCIQCIQ